jgi:lipopolysaccharide transport system permease protein
MNNQKWDVVIDAKKSGARSGLVGIYQYRDLLELIVKRDFVSFYKQTILGPIWFFVKPVFSSIVYLFIFGTIAGLSQDGIPPILFYISGLTLWSYFSETVLMTSDVLKSNASIFGKVYFPRLIMPISLRFSNGVKLIIQVALIILLMIYFYLVEGQVEFTFYVFLVPLIIIIVALQAFGVGLIVA